MDYSEQLLDPRWRLKKNKILKRDHYRCTNCNSNKELNVHHKYYMRGYRAWEYPNNALITFCKSCHTTWHKEHNIEVRDRVWCKNEEYKVPRKKPRKDRITSVQNKPKAKNVDRYIGLSEEQKRKLKIRDKNKISLIMQYSRIENVQGIFEKTRSLTIDELRETI